MAKVVGPLHSEEARGSVGSLTYNSWRGASTVKARGGPAGPATGSRLAMLQLGKAASFNWSELSDDQRAAWNAYGNSHQEAQWTGTPKRLSGHSWYVRIYVRLTLLGLSTIDSPPVGKATRTPVLQYVGYAGGELEIDWSWTPSGSAGGDYIEFYLAGPTSAGRKRTLHDAVRFDSMLLNTAIWIWTLSLASGRYTVFARSVTAEGLVGPWTLSDFAA